MTAKVSARQDKSGSPARDDFRIIGTAVIALLVLAGIGQVYFDFVRGDAANIRVVIGLILLNFALTLYGWRLYHEAAREIRERTAAEERAQTLASTDPLTGLLNRRALAEAVDELIFEAGTRRRAVAMLIVDIDGFKMVNDVHGHLTGDGLLRTAADAIRQALPKDALAARLGADEFAAAFMFDPASPMRVETIAGHIIERLGKPFDLGGIHIHVSASAGIAHSDDDCTSVDALLRRADIAMHAAKRIGRERSVWFDLGMERELQARSAIEVGLRTGIPRGEFVAYFEPQIDLATGKVHGFEALARWNHPVRGLVGPDEFIGVAEDCGLIGDLSMTVMRQAFEEARGWDSALTLSVNIAPNQLKDPWLAQKLVKLLVETGFPADRLEVEITERSLFENLGLAQSIVGSLKNQGIRLALDDFGSGYSSLGHLRALPFDRIKIDRSFVGSINDDPESAAIVMAVTRLAESLNLALTAEGIEDEAVQARLRSIGKYRGQGRLYGMAMPAAKVHKLLADQGLLQPTRANGAATARRAPTKRANRAG